MTWPFRTAGLLKPSGCIAGWCRTAPTTLSCWSTPIPSVDLARVAAKKLLCRAADGESPPGPADLDEFARLYPGATGSLAGRTGAYAKIVAEALASDHLAQPSQPDSRWPTFAGSLRRTKIVTGPVDVGSKQWRVELEKISATPEWRL